MDNGQNKKALQIADKVLKKQGDLHCAKVCAAMVESFVRLQNMYTNQGVARSFGYENTVLYCGAYKWGGRRRGIH